jgi:hypothetical protein
MVKIYDGYESYCEGGSFSSPRKNLGNKLFIYAACKIMADILEYDLEVPNNSQIQRMGNIELFPYGSITGRKKIEKPFIWISDMDVVNLESLEKITEMVRGGMLHTNASFTAYPLLKPYQDEVKLLYKDLVKPKRKSKDLIILLRDSNHDKSFSLPYDFYTDILDNETFDNLYVSCDHINNHQHFFSTLEKYKPKYLHDLGVVDLLKEITTFDKIIASQGTFSFWATWLSNAETIYWPLTDTGPNSYHNNPKAYYDVNLKVENEDRYKFIDIKR